MRKSTAITQLSTVLEIGQVIYKGGPTPMIVFSVGQMVLKLIK